MRKEACELKSFTWTHGLGKCGRRKDGEKDSGSVVRPVHRMGIHDVVVGERQRKQVQVAPSHVVLVQK